MKRRLGILAVLALLILVGTGCSETVKQQAIELLEQGQRYLAELDYDNAVAVFQKVIELEPRYMDAYLGLADAYLGMGKEAEALATLEDACQVIADGYGKADSMFASAEDVLERLAVMYQGLKESEKASDVAKLAEQLHMDTENIRKSIDMASQELDTDEGVPSGEINLDRQGEKENMEESGNQEERLEEGGSQEEKEHPGNFSGYTEEELERFMAGYQAAMRYPEGRREKAERHVGDGSFYGNSIHWFVRASAYDWWDGEKSQVIDCGEYYEVTNCKIEYPYVVPDEIVDQFTDGFEFDVSLYDQNGNPDTIHSVVINQDGQWWLTPDGNMDDYESRILEIDSSGKSVMCNLVHGEYTLGTIYRGSLFFRKDGIVHDTWFYESKTFEEYATEEQQGIYSVETDGVYHEEGFQGGKYGENSLNFFGEVVFDPDTGMIVECMEIFES